MLGGATVEDFSARFEGPEKKLEIILAAPRPDMRSNRDGRWDRVVRASGADIVSAVSTPRMDAYLLSESSLFVWPDGILMITCGRTILVDALEEILGLLHQDEIAFVFYERKNLLFPEDQPSDFEAEAAVLTRYFPGKSYRLGPANHDHVHLFYHHAGGAAPEKDATLQVLMNDLHPPAAQWFTPSGGLTPPEVDRRTGLDRLCPGADRDSHLFEPCGYSLNGVKGGGYFTVHVTPQPEGSYASFETNLLTMDHPEVVRRLLSIFRPGRFSMVLTSTAHETCMAIHPRMSRAPAGYRATERSRYELDCGYTITYYNYIATGGEV